MSSHCDPAVSPPWVCNSHPELAVSFPGVCNSHSELTATTAWWAHRLISQIAHSRVTVWAHLVCSLWGKWVTSKWVCRQLSCELSVLAESSNSFLGYQWWTDLETSQAKYKYTVFLRQNKGGGITPYATPPLIQPWQVTQKMIMGDNEHMHITSHKTS